METSILNTIKKQLGIEKDVTHFDEELIMHINACLLSITQLGVGPKNGFRREYYLGWTSWRKIRSRSC